MVMYLHNIPVRYTLFTIGCHEVNESCPRHSIPERMRRREFCTTRVDLSVSAFTRGQVQREIVNIPGANIRIEEPVGCEAHVEFLVQADAVEIDLVYRHLLRSSVMKDLKKIYVS